MEAASDKPSAAPTSGTNGLRSPAFLAMLTVAVLTAIPYAVPKLSRFRLLQPLPEGAGLVMVPAPAAVSAAPSAPVGETALVIETTEQSELRQPEQVELPAAAAELV